MNRVRYLTAIFLLALLAALCMPASLAAQVEEARVRIDGMV